MHQGPRGNLYHRLLIRPRGKRDTELIGRGSLPRHQQRRMVQPQRLEHEGLAPLQLGEEVLVVAPIYTQRQNRVDLLLDPALVVWPRRQHRHGEGERRGRRVVAREAHDEHVAHQVLLGETPLAISFCRLPLRGGCVVARVGDEGGQEGGTFLVRGPGVLGTGILLLLDEVLDVLARLVERDLLLAHILGQILQDGRRQLAGDHGQDQLVQHRRQRVAERKAAPVALLARPRREVLRRPQPDAHEGVQRDGPAVLAQRLVRVVRIREDPLVQHLLDLAHRLLPDKHAGALVEAGADDAFVARPVFALDLEEHRL